MTRIASIRVHRIPVPLVRPFVTAVRRADAIDVMLVQVVDSDGRTGWGEAPASWRVTGESPASITAAIDGPLADSVRGLSVAAVDDWTTAIRTAVHGNAAARSALECALYDLAAQAVGHPLAVLLGAPSQPAGFSVRTDMTLSAGSTHELVERAIEHRDSGFRTLKVKVDSGMDTVGALRELRTALGGEIGLRVDANQAWTPEEAVRVIRGCEDAGVGLELVEQPVPARDIAGLARVTANVSTPVLADEAVWTRPDLDAVVERRAADLVNVKLAKTGGLSEALALVARARSAGIGVIVGCMMESAVGVAAAASLAAAIEPEATHDLDAGLWMSASPVRGGLRYHGEDAVLEAAPGLGIHGLAIAEEGAA